MSKGEFTEVGFYVGRLNNIFKVRSIWFLFRGCTSSRDRTIHLFRHYSGQHLLGTFPNTSTQ